jgi:hypothetical protein
MTAAAGAAGVDLHGLSVLDARRLVLTTLRRSPPRAVLRFISGLGLHSVGGVSAIKTELERCFDAWKVRWRWEHGTFVVVTPDDPAAVGRAAAAAAAGSGGSGGGAAGARRRPQVALVSKAELAPWSSSSTARAWTHGSGGADLASSGSFPALGSAMPQQGRGRGRPAAGQQPAASLEAAAWPLAQEQRDLEQALRVSRDHPQPRSRLDGQRQNAGSAASSSSAYEQLVAQFQAQTQQQTQQQQQPPPQPPPQQQQQQRTTEGGGATAAAGGLGLVRQLSGSIRHATASAVAERDAADAQTARDAAELELVKAEAVEELVSWGFQRDAVLAALTACGGNLEQAAAALLD